MVPGLTLESRNHPVFCDLQRHRGAPEAKEFTAYGRQNLRRCREIAPDQPSRCDIGIAVQVVIHDRRVGRTGR
jgi:hypothetical protein